MGAGEKPGWGRDTNRRWLDEVGESFPPTMSSNISYRSPGSEEEEEAEEKRGDGQTEGFGKSLRRLALLLSPWTRPAKAEGPLAGLLPVSSRPHLSQ